MTALREKFSSRLGFVLATAGSAVGIGNLVGFPVNAAKNGGGAFLLIYLVFVFFICLPVLMAELAMGRHTRSNPVGAYSQISQHQQLWRLTGILKIITPFMIAVFYMVITVWLFVYLAMSASGQLDYLARPDSFNNIINSPHIFAAMLLVGAMVFFILSSGVQRGIERAAKVLMPSLFIMLLVLVVFVLSLDNALDGARFFIVPDITKLNAGVINNALSQAFFSLSLGMGILITYGSYLDKKDNILKAGSMVAVADTSVAFIAGLLILPAIFSFNPQVNTAELSDSSVSLIFVLLPNIFLTLQDTIGFFGAHTIATVFFLLVFFAAITSLVSIIEVPVAYLIDEKNITRRRALMLLALTGGALVIMSALSFGALTVFTEFTTYAGQSKSVFDVIIDIFYDTILPLNGLMVCLFVSFRWRHHQLTQELALGNNTYAGSWLDKYIRFSLSSFIPAILLLIFCNTVAQKFFAYSLLGF